MSKISANIKKYRTDKKITQNELAEMINVTRQTVSSWETNRTQPDIEMIELLSSALDVSIEELIYGRKNHVGLEPENKKNRSVMIIVLTVFGTLLTAAGLIIIFASFWEELEFAKNFFALLPLAAGFSIACYGLIKKKGNIIWQEAAAVVWPIGFAVTNALINSLNDIDMGFFPLLLLDALLLIPVMLTTKGVFSTAAFFYAITHSTMMLMSESKTEAIVFFILFCILYFTGIIYIRKNKTGDVRDIISFWAAVASGGIAFIWSCVNFTSRFGFDSTSVFFIAADVFFVGMYALSHKFSRTSVKSVFAVLAAGWTTVLIFPVIPRTDINIFDIVFVIFLLILCAVLCIIGFKDIRKDIYRLIIVCACAVQPVLMQIPATREIRLLLLIIPALTAAVCFIVKGISLAKLSVANIGMTDAAVIIIGVLIISAADIFIKGLAIAVAGITLLIVNKHLIKRFSEAKEAEDNA